MKIKTNPKIPSTMTNEGLDYLGRLARSVPENGVIVEIGPLFGSSTWVLAKNCHPSVKIYSIDTWEPAPWITNNVESKFRGCKPFSKEAFLHYTKDCPNVTAIQGWSPSVVADWDQPIDLFFDDATHGDPGFSENVNFFLPFVKEGAYLCGDDYSNGWPDIVRVVDEFANKWGVHPEVSGRVWAVQKPQSDNTISQKVYEDISTSDSSPKVSINCKTLSGAVYDLSDGVWSGAIHKKDRLSEISIAQNWSIPDLAIEWELRDSNGKKHGPFNSTDKFTCEPDTWITDIRLCLTGKNSKNYSVEYQTAFCWHKGGGKRYPVSSLQKNGAWITSDHPKVAITAIKVKILSKKDEVNRKLHSIKSSKSLKLGAFTKKVYNYISKRT